MALTVFETAEQLHPCNAVEQGGGDACKLAAAPAAENMLKETDHGGADDDRPERDDVWNMIQAQKPAAAPKQEQAAQYVHPLVRRSSSLLTQKSLEICTESLGSETGSDGFSSDGAATDRSSCPGSDDDERGEEEVAAATPPLAARAAFPPPLPSLARRCTVGGALEMRQHRSDGRLVVQAVPVASPALFRAQRRGGRLLLSFADTATSDVVAEPTEQQVEDEEEEEEEEVEVVDRGTVVEFKVSTQPQASGPRVHRSALVINKFVGAEPAASREITDAVPAAPQHPPPRPLRRPTGSATTAIAALAAASALSAAAPAQDNGEYDDEEAVPGATLGENKLLMTAARRRRSKEELLKHMRRCGQLSGKLFFWEPRIATSS